MILSFKKYRPKIHPKAYVAPNASVIGRVRIGADSSIWFGAVVRGDINRIQIGKRTNIQDNCVLHVERDLACVLGDGIIVGHQATVHACTVEDGVLVGIGARILNGAKIGTGSIIGAGTVVKEGAKIPPNSLIVGVPGKIVRCVTAKEHRYIRKSARQYAALAMWYKNRDAAAEAYGITFLDDMSPILQ
jgi:carbonic anhydrase/acetyltransferase-like protein (isoleucine patch superfamily)